MSLEQFTSALDAAHIAAFEYGALHQRTKAAFASVQRLYNAHVAECDRLRAVVAEFVSDFEACNAGDEDEWPDLKVTYDKARAALDR